MKKLIDSIKSVATSFALVLLVATVTWGAVYLASKPIESPTVEKVQIQYYARIAAIYEGNVDWRFYITTKMLEKMAPQFIGKPMLLGHDWRNPNVCVGRVVDAAVKEDVFGHYVEVVVLINSDEAADMIARDAYHSVSIGWETLKAICMIDNLDPEICGHEPGHRYKIGTHVLNSRHIIQEATMHEVSFVNVPASPNARVLELAAHRLSCSDKSK